METKFTPGPWSFVPSIPEQGFECFWIENGVQQITAIDGPQNDEQEANARLIAAAPELLAALQGAERRLAMLHVLNSGDLAGAIYADQMNARAALAKATGSKP